MIFKKYLLFYVLNICNSTEEKNMSKYSIINKIDNWPYTIPSILLFLWIDRIFIPFVKYIFKKTNIINKPQTSIKLTNITSASDSW